jgi:hypothetical protein
MKKQQSAGFVIVQWTFHRSTDNWWCLTNRRNSEEGYTWFSGMPRVCNEAPLSFTERDIKVNLLFHSQKKNLNWRETLKYKFVFNIGPNVLPVNITSASVCYIIKFLLSLKNGRNNSMKRDILNILTKFRITRSVGLVHRLIFRTQHRVSEIGCSCPQVKICEGTYSNGSVRKSWVQWWRLSLSNEPNWVMHPHSFTWERKQMQSEKRRVLLEYLIMDRVKNKH